MASPADKSLLDLLDKWLTSLELHTQYSALDDDSYWKIQPWIEHQRPTRWILDLATQKTLALKAQVQARIDAGDAQFSDSLEQVIFLANLVGSDHIERFIPMAEKQNEAAITGTREMPKFVERKGSPSAKSPAKPAGKDSVPDGAVPQGDPVLAATEQVIADAVRLVQWGRKWFELPELVARMAGRPPAAEVRRILKENKPTIDEKARK